MRTESVGVERLDLLVKTDDGGSIHYCTIEDFFKKFKPSAATLRDMISGAYFRPNGVSGCYYCIIVNIHCPFPVA